MRSLTRSALLVAAAMAAASPCAAQGGGFNLSWGDCSFFGVMQRNFACNTNVGVNTFVASAVAGVEMPQVVGVTAIVDILTNQAALSNWWQLNSGGCRASTPSFLTANFDFRSNGNCLDPWGGTAQGNLVYQPGFYGPNHARIAVFIGVPSSVALTDFDEYYVFKIALSNARSVGDGSCAGCSDGACIFLRAISLAQSGDIGDRMITTTLARSLVLWQPGGSNVTGCYTPTRAPTWGAVKSLYR